MSEVFDACVIGSGAGGGPVAALLAEAGKRVVVLEKGPWFDERQFLRDEIVQCRRPTFWPQAKDEPQVLEMAGQGVAGAGRPTGDFWNGSLVGGSSVLMSGFFMRLKPDDFRALSTYGAVAGADVADWPLRYEDLEPWYARAEREVGVSGRLVALPPTIADRRSTESLPLPATREHPLGGLVDATCRRLGLNPIPLPRAVLPLDQRGRKACDYNGYCGSYGCRTGAKGSSLAAWIPRALATGRCEVRPHAMVRALGTDASGRNVVAASYVDRAGRSQAVRARVFVVACQAIESARLLLNSKNAHHPYGLANASGLVGRNLIFSTFGAGWGEFHRSDLRARPELLASREPFVNRIVQDWYWFDPRDPGRRNAGRTPPGRGMQKAGTLNFLLMHPNPISGAETQAFSDHRRTAPLWGQALKDRLGYWFREVKPLKFEIFCDWLPWANSRVTIDPVVKDRWGTPVSRIRAFSHPRSRKSADLLVQQGVRLLTEMGARNARPVRSYGGPSVNLIAGTCRFGEDPRRSVLDRDCRAHDVENLYVTDASFMPSGGSVPFTFTIYANALRVADVIKSRV